MFAIGHAATALLVKRVFPEARMLLGLILDPIGHAPYIAPASGVSCWWTYKGGRTLLVVIVAFNIANLSFLSAAIRVRKNSWLSVPWRL